RKMGLPASEAAARVASVQETLNAGAMREPVAGPFHYATRPDGSSVFGEDQRDIFWVDGDRTTIRLLPGILTELRAPLSEYLRSLMPKLLALLEVPLLHASACIIQSDLLALSGKSGAGKTTTIRALGDAGAAVVSEDLVVLDSGADAPRVYLGGEA